MTDIYDQATEREIRDTEIAIANARKPINQLPHGVCNSCGASCVGAFCDEDCRNQHAKELRMAKINGRQA